MRNLLWFDVRKTIISIIGDTHHIEKNECGKKPCEHTHYWWSACEASAFGKGSQKMQWQKVTTSSSACITGTCWEGWTPSHPISQPAAPAQPFPQQKPPTLRSTSVTPGAGWRAEERVSRLLPLWWWMETRLLVTGTLQCTWKYKYKVHMKLIWCYKPMSPW